jgi:hypothetical protein
LIAALFTRTSSRPIRVDSLERALQLLALNYGRREEQRLAVGELGASTLERRVSDVHDSDSVAVP